MFRSVFNTVIRNRIINGGDPKKNLSLFLSHLHITVSSFSSSSFEVSYLMNSCGLSQTEAKSASKKLQFETTSNPDSVLTLFEDYGFTKPHISKIITKNPMILVCDPHKILKPKFDYFLSRDITALELANVLSTNPQILYRSIERHFIPFFEFVKKIVGTDRDVFRILQRTCIPADADGKLRLNIQVLRQEGVPQRYIVKYFINQPRTFMMGTEKFKEIVEEVKGLGFNPYKFAFLSAIHVIASMSKPTWEKKLNAYKEWGWSEDQILNAFKMLPVCMRHSEKKISTTMDYIVNQMGLSSLLVASCPRMLNYSLEKRIIPRFSVYRNLVSKGLINKDLVCINSFLSITNESFLHKFVVKYEEEAPELMKNLAAITDAEDTEQYHQCCGGIGYPVLTGEIKQRRGFQCKASSSEKGKMLGDVVGDRRLEVN